MFYRIYHKNKLISKRSKLCNNIFSKLRGFMFNFSKSYDSIIIKSKNSSIHMFFVFFPLKIVWVDSRLKVIQIKKAYPFISVYSPQKGSVLILEFKKNIKLNIGDKINLKISD